MIKHSILKYVGRPWHMEVSKNRTTTHLDDIFQRGPCSPSQLSAISIYISCTWGMGTILQGPIQKMSFCRQHSEQQGRSDKALLVQYFFLVCSAWTCRIPVKELYNQWVVPAGAVGSLPWRCLSQTQKQNHHYLLQRRKSDRRGFQSCSNGNMFAFKSMIHPSSFMQFYFKLKWIIIITFGGRISQYPLR